MMVHRQCDCSCEQKVGASGVKICSSEKCTPFLLMVTLPYQKSFMEDMIHQRKASAAISASSNVPKITCYLDATGQVNQYGYLLYTFMVINPSTRRGCPIAHCISASKTADVTAEFLSFIKKNIAGFCMEQIIMDKDEACLNGVRKFEKAEGLPPINIFLCYFHMLQAVRRWLRDGSHNVNAQTQRFVITSMQNCHKATTVAKFDEEYKKLKDLLTKQGALLLLKYLDTNWFVQSPFAKLWSKAHVPRLSDPITSYTNNFIESWHKLLKDYALESKKNKRIGNLVRCLVDMGDILQCALYGLILCDP